MVYVAAGQLAVILLLVAALLLRETWHDREMERAGLVAIDERRELLNRIQRPEMIPVRPATQPPEASGRDVAALAKIGTVAMEPASEH